MSENLRERADDIVSILSRRAAAERPADLDRLRDYCDGFTWSELDCQPLDILTEMVAKRLRASGVISF